MFLRRPNKKKKFERLGPSEKRKKKKTSREKKTPWAKREKSV